MRRALGAWLAASVICGAATARGAELRSDVRVGEVLVVVLKNAQRYTGRVAEYEPGSHVRLGLEDGRLLTFVLAAVAELRAPRPDDSLPAAAAAAPIKPPSGPPGSPDAWVRVVLPNAPGLNLESTGDALVHVPRDEWKWTQECASPCGEWVSRQRTFRLRMSADISRPFRLRADVATDEREVLVSEVDVSFRPPHQGLLRTGIGLLIAIGPSLTLGGLLLAIGAPGGSPNYGLVGSGYAFMGLAGLSLLVGPPMIAAGRSSVRIKTYLGPTRY